MLKGDLEQHQGMDWTTGPRPNFDSKGAVEEDPRFQDAYATLIADYLDDEEKLVEFLHYSDSLEKLASNIDETTRARARRDPPVPYECTLGYHISRIRKEDQLRAEEEDREAIAQELERLKRDKNIILTTLRVVRYYPFDVEARAVNFEINRNIDPRYPPRLDITLTYLRPSRVLLALARPRDKGKKPEEPIPQDQPPKGGFHAEEEIAGDEDPNDKGAAWSNSVPIDLIALLDKGKRLEKRATSPYNPVPGSEAEDWDDGDDSSSSDYESSVSDNGLPRRRRARRMPTEKERSEQAAFAEKIKTETKARANTPVTEHDKLPSIRERNRSQSYEEWFAYFLQKEGRLNREESKYFLSARQEMERRVFKEIDVLIVSLNNSGVVEAFDPSILIVDEGGQASWPSLFVPMTTFKGYQAMLIFGDPQQLTPTVMARAFTEGPKSERFRNSLDCLTGDAVAHNGIDLLEDLPYTEGASAELHLEESDDTYKLIVMLKRGHERLGCNNMEAYAKSYQPPYRTYGMGLRSSSALPKTPERSTSPTTQQSPLDVRIRRSNPSDKGTAGLSGSEGHLQQKFKRRRPKPKRRTEKGNRRPNVSRGHNATLVKPGAEGGDLFGDVKKKGAPDPATTQQDPSGEAMEQ
ncbi:MAG: hypothetical protein Q9219_002503 [cf. Caloplaca sp. 3 TL-2023]